MATTIATPTYALGGITFNTVDNNGVSWGVQPSPGWFDGPDVRLNQTPIARYDGLYRATSFRQGRTITLTGWCRAPTKALAVAARDAFNGLFASGGQLVLTVTDDTQTRTATVELAGPPKSTPAGTGSEFDWQLVLSAADPRKYDVNQQSANTPLPSAASGLDWSTGGGLDWSTGGGLNWGTATSNGTLTITNSGLADSWPVFTLVGFLSSPVITNQATGQALSYTGLLKTGDQLVITTSPYARSVLLNGSTDRRPSLVTAQWASVAAGSSATFALSSSSGADTGSVTATLYPAWW